MEPENTLDNLEAMQIDELASLRKYGDLPSFKLNSIDSILIKRLAALNHQQWGKNEFIPDKTFVQFQGSEKYDSIIFSRIYSYSMNRFGEIDSETGQIIPFQQIFWSALKVKAPEILKNHIFNNKLSCPDIIFNGDGQEIGRLSDIHSISDYLAINNAASTILFALESAYNSANRKQKQLIKAWFTLTSLEYTRSDVCLYSFAKYIDNTLKDSLIMNPKLKYSEILQQYFCCAPRTVRHKLKTAEKLVLDAHRKNNKRS